MKLSDFDSGSPPPITRKAFPASEQSRQSSRTLLALGGVALLAVGAVCNEWFLAWALSDDGILEGESKAIIRFLNLVFLLAGGFFLAKATLFRVKGARQTLSALPFVHSTYGRFSPAVRRLRDASERQPTGRLLFILNIVAVLFYSFIAIRFDYIQNVEALIFSTPDASTYKDVADWLFGTNHSSSSTQVRPFLYPLLLGGAYYGGVYAVWFMQFVFWLAAVNCTALASRRFTGRNLALVASFLLLASNPSLIALTFHALTETTVVLLLAVWVLLLAKSNAPRFRPKSAFALTFVLSLLTVVKPVYQLHLSVFLLLLVGCVFFQRVDKTRMGLVLVLALLPVFFQLGLMVRLHNLWTLSQIGGVVVKYSYFSKVYKKAAEPALDKEARLAHVDAYDQRQMLHILAKNAWTSLSVYGSNVLTNLADRSNFINAEAHPRLLQITRTCGEFYILLHLLFFPLLLYACWARGLLFTFRVGVIYAFFAIIVAMSGLVYTQGDRMIIVALPLWVTAYMYVLSRETMPPQSEAAL